MNAHPVEAPSADDSIGDNDVLLEVRDLDVRYITAEASIPACTEVSLAVRRGEILGVAGESGSGKSTLITAIAQLQRPPAVTTNGQVLLHRAGATTDLLSLDDDALRRLRWQSISVVLQSAMDALNPVRRLQAQFVDVMRTHDRGLSKAQAAERAAELLSMVGIPADRLRAYPHEMSGGMRQRATIALALACQPDLVVMDEPTTAVDVVMQRQILGQVLRLRRQLGFSVIFVTHDLSLLLEFADRIAVMYAGRLVELGPASQIYQDPKHCYTRGLRDSFPPLHGPKNTLAGIPGSPPDLRTPSPGCPFAPRCPRRFGPCDTQLPPLRAAEPAWWVACHLHDPAMASESATDKQGEQP